MAETNLSLFKRSNRIWYVAYTINGRRKWKSTKRTDKGEALQFVRTLDLSQVKRPRLPKDLNDFLCQFYDFARATYRDKTNELYSNVGKRIATLAGSTRLQDITAKSWDDYNVLRSPHMSSTTLNIEQRTLKAIMNRAVAWEYLTVSHFAKMKCVKVAEVPPNYFTREEFEKLLSLVEEDWLRDAIIFSVATGIRRGELVNLRWSDVDHARRTITIQSSSDFRVKGNKMRIVPLSSVALAIITHRAKQSDCPYVFSRNGKQLWGNWITELFRWYVKKAGLYDKRLHWHNLRSSFASWLVAGGVSLYAVSKLLGHSSVTLTQRHYARLAPETLHDTVDLIRLDSPPHMQENQCA